MITREDAKKMVSDLVECTCIDAYRLRNLSAPDCAACNYTLDLFDIVEQLLKERDLAIEQLKAAELRAETYLEVAIAIDRQFIGGTLNPIKYHEERIRAEVARIMKEKGGR